MRYLGCMLVLVAISTPAIAKPVSVDGHIRRDGTYVPSHQRTAPNSTINDNWTTKPNVNPNTGRAGTREPTYGGWGSSSNSGRSRSSSTWGN